ncbi:hypothetical protein ACWF99_20910 [Nocardia sp. NPDC055002]
MSDKDAGLLSDGIRIATDAGVGAHTIGVMRNPWQPMVYPTLRGENAPRVDPRYLHPVAPGQNKLLERTFNSLPAQNGPSGNPLEFSRQVKGAVGEPLLNQFNHLLGDKFLVGGGAGAKIVPPAGGAAFEPDSITARRQSPWSRMRNIVIGDSKVGPRAGYTAGQRPGFKTYNEGGHALTPFKHPTSPAKSNTFLPDEITKLQDKNILQRPAAVSHVEIARFDRHVNATPRLINSTLKNWDRWIPAPNPTQVKARESLTAIAKAMPDTRYDRINNNILWAQQNAAKIPGAGVVQKVTRAPISAGVGFGNLLLKSKPVAGVTQKIANSSLASATANLANSNTASKISKVASSPVGKLGGRALGVVGTGLAIGSDIKNGESVKKAVVTNGVGLGASIAAGAAVGTMIPVPVVGTVAGAVVGAAVGLGATKAAKKGWDWAANKFKKKMADGGPVLGAGSSVGDIIPAMLSHGEYVVNAASAGRFKPLLDSINKGVPGFAPTGMNPAMSSVLEKASGGFGDAAKAFVSGQSGDVMKTFGLKDTPAAMKAGTQAAELLKSAGPQLGAMVGSAAKQAVPAKALVASAMAKGGAVDQSMTINLQTPDLDTAFQKSKTLEAQRALTYAGRW